MQNLFDQLFDMLMWIPRELYSMLLDGLLAAITAIPVPAWAASAGSYALSISSDVMYWAAPFQLGSGLAILTSAYGVRFLIRRIPVIG